MMSTPYPIGTIGTPWSETERQQWKKQQTTKRSYLNDVVTEIDTLAMEFDKVCYGQLNYDTQYDLFVLQTRNWDHDKPTALVTGGVHGYETSGVFGALAFLSRLGKHYEQQFNLVVAPCISPWGYETINRWNPAAIDPNRSFYADSPAPEAAQLMQYFTQKRFEFLVHVDLHETTDSDNTEFRPALAARDGKINQNWNIPDGFYLVGHTQKPEPEFQQAVIKEVELVTAIAPADDNGNLIGVPLEQFGVINYDASKLGLCMGLSQARFVTTTEVYPDGALATPQNCVDGQVAAVKGALDYVAKICKR